MPQPAERRVNIHCSRAHFFEERAQLVLIHRKLQDSSAGVARRDARIPAKEVPLTHLNSLGPKEGSRHNHSYMNKPATETLPQICSEVGLSCQSCTAETARQVAAVCKGLRGKAIGQMFVQLYPNAACAPAHKMFAAHYESASETPKRRDFMSVRPAAMA